MCISTVCSKVVHVFVCDQFVHRPIRMIVHIIWTNAGLLSTSYRLQLVYNHVKHLSYIMILWFAVCQSNNVRERFSIICKMDFQYRYSYGSVTYPGSLCWLGIVWATSLL